MTFKIDGYGPLKTPVKGNVTSMSRADARRVYQNTIDSIPDRLEALAHLCELNGYTNDPAGWTKMIDDHAELEPQDEGMPLYLTPVWRNIVLDISLAMSDLLIQRSNGTISWKFYHGSKNSPDFHRPVLVGFNVPSKSYHVQLFRIITGKALRSAAGRPMDDLGDYLEFLASKDVAR